MSGNVLLVLVSVVILGTIESNGQTAAEEVFAFANESGTHPGRSWYWSSSKESGKIV